MQLETIETSRAGGGTSQHCHSLPKQPTPPSFLNPPRKWQQSMEGAVSAWRYPICPPQPRLPHPSHAAWPQVLGQHLGPGLPALVPFVSPVALCSGRRRSQQCPNHPQQGPPGSSTAPTASWCGVTKLGGSSAGTEQEPRSGPLRLSTGGNCSHPTKHLASKIYVWNGFMVHNVGCKRCVINIGAAQGCRGEVVRGQHSSDFHRRLRLRESSPHRIPTTPQNLS